MRASSLAVLALVALSGCMGTLSPAEHLRDAVHQVNEGARWGRTDIAVDRVAGPFRERFMRSRRAWGRTVQIADLELVDVRVEGIAASTASSVVTYSWYDLATMSLRTTTVRQEWARDGNGFRLSREEVLEGDPSLISVPEPATSGGDDAQNDSTADDDAGWQPVHG